MKYSEVELRDLVQWGNIGTKWMIGQGDLGGLLQPW